MRYHQIDSELFVHNREKFTAELKPNSLAVFNSNDILTSSADSTRTFRQHRDIFWLSGVDQEESILVLFPDCHDEKHREILFVRETNEHIKVWEGEKLTKEKATEVSGVKTVYWLDQFETVFKNVMAETEFVYLNTNEHLRVATHNETREARFVKKTIADWPLHKYERSQPILHKVRAVKHSIEVDLMRQACQLTNQGLRRILKFIEPGVMEYEIEAELWHEFVRNRSTGFAYTPIIASGNNGNVLHYIENNDRCDDGEVILMDFGAEYANYSSDLTRCVPVNGRFTDRQKEVYNSVLHVKDESAKLLVPGVTLKEYHKQVGELMEEQLIKLNLLNQKEIDDAPESWPAYKKYFPHGTSHYIGLDTHDVGSWINPIEVGNVFTVEPGIYIPEEGFGIRLEDDYLITENGQDNLMADIPIAAEEIEDLMNG